MKNRSDVIHIFAPCSPDEPNSAEDSGIRQRSEQALYAAAVQPVKAVEDATRDKVNIKIAIIIPKK